MDMESDDSSSSSLHVVICPWLAFGHLLPCLDLAQRLASRGHHVTFVSTPRKIARLPPVRPAAVAPLLEFVALPLPRVDGLPEGAESTNDVPFDKFELHREAFDGLTAPFSEFLAAACAGGNRPDWVIIDTFHHWAAAAAMENKVPCAFLLLAAAATVATWAGRLPTEHTTVPSGVGRAGKAPPRFEKERKKLSTTQRASGMSMVERYTLALQRCDLVAIRSCLEWEPEGIPLVPTHGGKPVVPLGLLPPSSPEAKGGVSDADDATVRWLDAQPLKSVVYVALGTEAPLRAEHVRELALGLELAGTHFLWALRNSSFSSSGVPAEDADISTLPPGFEERTRGRGLVATGWVPQISVLAHGAVAAFLTHCGWSSTIEGLLFGHPLIMLPITGDQGPNARLMEGRKVGVQVMRDETDGSFDREAVAAAVRAVAVEEEGRRTFTANARKMREIAADSECHERCIDGFIHQLRSYKQLN